jgi:hypothetical protein
MTACELCLGNAPTGSWPPRGQLDGKRLNRKSVPGRMLILFKIDLFHVKQAKSAPFALRVLKLLAYFWLLYFEVSVCFHVFQ